MIKSIAISPHHIDIDYLNKIDFTLKLADMYGFDEIFTTVHLPEYSLSQQLDCFDAIVDKARKYGFDITVDIGGPGQPVAGFGTVGAADVVFADAVFGVAFQPGQAHVPFHRDDYLPYVDVGEHIVGGEDLEVQVLLSGPG